MGYSSKPGLERDPLVVINDLGRQVRTCADKRARAYGMTRAQWMILVHLDRQPGITQNELAGLIEVEPITAGRLVDRLEARGFVERRADPKDRRMWRLHVTEAACPMLKEIAEARVELNRILTEGVDAAALEAAIDCLLRMKTNLACDARPILKTV
jgi:MarR family transcriptional regulator for hemolysin